MRFVFLFVALLIPSLSFAIEAPPDRWPSSYAVPIVHGLDAFVAFDGDQVLVNVDLLIGQHIGVFDGKSIVPVAIEQTHFWLSESRPSAPTWDGHPQRTRERLSMDVLPSSRWSGLLSRQLQT